jgi:hypothetical protein
MLRLPQSKRTSKAQEALVKGLNDLIQRRIAEYNNDNSLGTWRNLPLESLSNAEVLARGEADARFKQWAGHYQEHAAKVRDEMVTKK